VEAETLAKICWSLAVQLQGMVGKGCWDRCLKALERIDLKETKFMAEAVNDRLARALGTPDDYKTAFKSLARDVRSRLLCWVSVAWTLLVVAPAWAQDIVFQGIDFAEWQHPQGLVNVSSSGVEVKRFGTGFNAVANAGEFTSSVIGNYGVRSERTPSNPADAHRVTDQDSNTWWQPDAADSVQHWWLEIDLGRAVVASKLRVIFPDTTGAKPFTFFSVYTSPGIPVFGGSVRRVVFNRLGRPVNNNTKRMVEFDLVTRDLSPAKGENMINSDTLDFDIIRFVRFEAIGRTPDAALAEIEVDGVGFNLSSRVATESREENGEPHWGGRTWTSKDRDCPGCGKGSGADALIDQDLGFRWWAIEAAYKGNWRDTGIWSVVDFGSIFRVNRMVWLPIVAQASPITYGFERDRQCGWAFFDFLTSDGTPSSNTEPTVEGPFEYELLSQVDNSSSGTGARHLFDFQFRPERCGKFYGAI
jgi:hypothetical protein